MKNRFLTQKRIRDIILALSTLSILIGGILQLCNIHWGKLLTTIGLMVGIIALLGNSAIVGLKNKKNEKEKN